jgi:hypothetical protein
MRVSPLCKAWDNFPQYTAVTAPTSPSPANTGRNNYLPPTFHHLHSTFFLVRIYLVNNAWTVILYWGERRLCIPPQFVFLESYMRAFGISITGIFVSSFEIVHGFCWDPSGGTNIYVLKYYFLNLPCRFDVLQ